MAQVVVTGAGRGLGRAVVDELVEHGWTVWATDISDEHLSDSRAQHTSVMDVSDEQAVSETMTRVHTAGGVDALVNNAGIFPLAPWDASTVDMWYRVLAVNVVGTSLCAQAAARSMIERGVHGAIVNVASLTFYKGIETGTVYSASKGAVVGLTRSLARALGPHSIRVNAVGPGLMATEGNLELVARGEFPATRLQGTDPDRQLPGSTQPRGVASLIGFLLSDAAREITGQVVAADGGSIFL